MLMESPLTPLIEKIQGLGQVQLYHGPRHPQTPDVKIGHVLQDFLSENDFLRQVVAYEYPRHRWEKDNFTIRDEYRSLVGEVLAGLKQRS